MRGPLGATSKCVRNRRSDTPGRPVHSARQRLQRWHLDTGRLRGRLALKKTGVKDELCKKNKVRDAVAVKKGRRARTQASIFALTNTARRILLHRWNVDFYRAAQNVNEISRRWKYFFVISLRGLFRLPVFFFFLFVSSSTS